VTTADYARAVDAMTAALGAPTKTGSTDPLVYARAAWEHAQWVVIVWREERGVIVYAHRRYDGPGQHVGHLVVTPSAGLLARLGAQCACLRLRKTLARLGRIPAWKVRAVKRHGVPVTFARVRRGETAETLLGLDRDRSGVTLCALDVAVAVARAVMTDTAGETL